MYELGTFSQIWSQIMKVFSLKTFVVYGSYVYAHMNFKSYSSYIYVYVRMYFCQLYVACLGVFCTRYLENEW